MMQDDNNSVREALARVNEQRRDRVVQAILDFEWDNYRLHEVDELAREVKEDIAEDGESDRMDWARDLADAVIEAHKPLAVAPDEGPSGVSE